MKMIRLNVLFILAMGVTHSFAFNLPEQTIKSYECNERCPQLSHEALQEAWNISNTFLLDEARTNRQQSYGYTKRVTSTQLNAGVKISTTAPGAVIRISPLQKNQVMPPLHITTPKKQVLGLKEASSQYSQDSALDESIDTSTHQTITQINPQLGAGEFIIQSSGIHALQGAKAQTNAAYMIHVLDKYSPDFLQIETNATHYHHGDTVITTLSFGEVSHETSDISAFIVGPQGQKIPLEFTKEGFNTFKASTVLTSEVNDKGENWHVEVDVVCGAGHSLFRRSGHTAFSYSIPSARLVRIQKSPTKPLTFVASIEVATASRYVLQSVLFEKNEAGAPIPLKMLQKAQWLEPGVQQVEFSVEDIKQVTEDNLYLGYFHLIDYGQIKTVYQFDELLKLNQLT
jgi:hypothetical protein